MTDAIAQVVGWTLVHSLWQGAAVAAIAAILLGLVPRASARVRYAILCGALFTHLAAPVVTAVVLTPGAVAATRAPSLTVVAGALTERPSAGADAEAARLTSPAAAGSRLEQLSTRLSRVLPDAGGLERFLPIAAAFWMFGVVVSALRRVGGWLVLRRLVARAVPAGNVLDARVRHLARVMGIQRGVSILVSTEVTGPFTSGWLRPVIVMPLSMLSGLDPVHVDAILAHELAHVRRWDYVVAVVQSVALTVLFHHPVTWWLDRRLRIEREFCCDDLAVAASRDRVGYVRALAELESLRLGLPSLALAATDGSLEQRVVRLLGGRTPAASAGWVPAATLLAVALMAGALEAANVPAPSTPRADSTVTPSAPTAASPNDRALLPPTQQGGGVIRHPDPSASFEARWAWALDNARRRSDSDVVTIGWLVRSAINDGGSVVSSTDGTSLRPGRAVGDVLGLPGTTRGVAILLTWSGGSGGELTAVRLRDLTAAITRSDRPLLWLHTASDAASLTRIEQLMASATESSVRSELGAALTLHDDRERVLRAVTRVLDSERDDHVRSETMAWLGNRVRDSAVVALLRRAIDDPSPEVRDEAVSALGGARDARGRAVLLELIGSSKHSDVRSEAVQRLAGGGDDVVAVLLRVAFDDPEDDVRSEAVDAIRGTNSTAATQALRDIAQRHSDRRLRSEARDALDARGFR